MIEEDIQNLENRLDKIDSILIYLAKIVITKPIDHGESCRDYQREEIKKYGWYTGYCVCKADQINEYLNLQKQAILYDKEIKELKKEFRLKEKKKKFKR